MLPPLRLPPPLPFAASATPPPAAATPTMIHGAFDPPFFTGAAAARCCTISSVAFWNRSRTFGETSKAESCRVSSRLTASRKLALAKASWPSPTYAIPRLR